MAVVPISISIYCDRCRKHTATFSLFPPGTYQDPQKLSSVPFAESNWVLERLGFMCTRLWFSVGENTMPCESGPLTGRINLGCGAIEPLHEKEARKHAGEKYFDILCLLEKNDFKAVEKIKSDLVGFHCWTCSKSYCEECWKIGPDIVDDGFYDFTLGTCPKGHEHIVQD